MSSASAAKRVFSRDFKLTVARQLVSGKRRISQICREHSIFPPPSTANRARFLRERPTVNAALASDSPAGLVIRPFFLSDVVSKPAAENYGCYCPILPVRWPNLGHQNCCRI
jgi:hypothetical protein